ncbi:MAG: mercuric ion transporter MerT [Polaromonas sp.]|uniref:mercuric ion transporter MerT n=1 Tax=Polaromonas sp. TaxID=1869339 RepID=UPI00272F4C66|nr:mercuric ion transporter MerT [Polaromonas sp.]MDP1739809.1 mercuric ion transporter MerT [Polaromonas sp.]MDP1955763.1 mercuric ion transporter MerT [Polaromonas sp.]MDP3355298.1 mercuric ion transporter MerT [Polaromonas sp.]MDP3751641.1 mercuric ion transporter MerT [Polaromonas sp.]
MATDNPTKTALAAGALAAILASACCLGPLLLVSVGLGGAWLSNLASLEPYRPWFIGAALLALLLAAKRIYRPAADCKPGDICALPAAQTGYKALLMAVAALVLIALSYPYLAPLLY